MPWNHATSVLPHLWQVVCPIVSSFVLPGGWPGTHRIAPRITIVTSQVRTARPARAHDDGLDPVPSRRVRPHVGPPLAQGEPVPAELAPCPPLFPRHASTRVTAPLPGSASIHPCPHGH